MAINSVAHYVICFLISIPSFAATLAAQVTLDMPAPEFLERRERAYDLLPDGILLLHARSVPASRDQHGFLQDPNFYYFSGLNTAMGAILAIDGSRRETWLFVPDSLSGLPSGALALALIPPGERAQAGLLIEHVVPWSGFIPYLDRRLQASSPPTIYLVSRSTTESNPRGLLAVGGPDQLWRQALAYRWPNIGIASAWREVASLRQVKSDGEVEALRRAAAASTAALQRGIGAVAPGRRQRAVEGLILAACMQAGGEGPYFWPWVMAGPNAVFPKPYHQFAHDYRHLDRILTNGELVRLDIGCDVDHYNGDVGRTVPVSGTFTRGQGEVVDLLAEAYRAGLSEIRDGVPVDTIVQAALRRVAELAGSMETLLGKQAVAHLLSSTGGRYFFVHSQGLASSEGSFDILRRGMVVCWEPIFAVDGQGFYLEDMLLVTETGYELLTPNLPYTAAEIETFMARE